MHALVSKQGPLDFGTRMSTGHSQLASFRVADTTEAKHMQARPKTPKFDDGLVTTAAKVAFLGRQVPNLLRRLLQWRADTCTIR